MRKIFITLIVVALTVASCKRYKVKDLAGVYSDMNDKKIEDVMANGVGQFRILDLNSDGTMEDKGIGIFFNPNPKLFFKVHGIWRIVGDSIELTTGPNEIKRDEPTYFDIEDGIDTYRIAIRDLKKNYDFTPE